MEEKKKKRLRFKAPLVLGIIAVIAAILIIRSGIFTVAESEEAVIQTFGRFTNHVGPGLHVKLPWPIQKVTILPVQRTQKLELGYYQDEDGQYHSDEIDSLMITGDMNVVNIDFFVEWKISDPVKYLFASEDPKAVLSNMLMSSVRSIVGTKNIDNTLTSGKFEIQNEVQDMLMEKLTDNDVGIQILDVKVNDSQPPTEKVAKAFRDVETAKQEKDTTLNQATEYRNRKIPHANAQADKLIKQAEAYKQTRINEATGLKDRYLAVYSEYARFPKMTRKRMYLEILEDILPNVRVVIDGGGNVQKYLPLGEGVNPAVVDGEDDSSEAEEGKNDKK